MAHADDIIVLDDDDDDEKPHCSTAKKPSESPAPQTNGRKGGGESQNKGQCMSAENKKLFEEFVDYCSGLTEDHPEVIPFLKGRLAQANQTFLSSVEFRNVLGRCLTRVQSKRSKIYVYINELCTSLKANSQKRKLTLKPSTKSTPSVKQVEEVKEENEEKEEEEPVKKTGSKRQIRYLENLLRIYSREIQKLQERELTLDELEEEDSPYIQEARLKRKILLIFQKLCELKDCPSLTGRVIEQRIPYRGTRYPEVNRRIEKFINESRDGFPDYGDVLRVIERACDRHGLGLPRRKIQGMAQDAFREIGNLLQERRHLDMVYNFGCHLTDSYKAGTDPAQQDPSLSRRLRENRGMALARLDEVIKLYAEKQDEGEDEERRKRKKDTETASTSKGGKVSPVQSRNTPTPPSQNSEDEEESVEESETDIEEELKQAEQVSEGEEDEEATEVPNNEENDGDQRMEIPSTPPNLPAKEANDEDEGDDDLNEDNDEEQMEDISQPPTPLSDEEEEFNLQETESNIQESPTCSATQIHKPHPCSTKADNEEKENHEEARNTSELETVEDCKKDVNVDNGETHEESDMPYSENKTLIAKESDIKSELPSSTDGSVVEEDMADGALPHEDSHSDTTADPAHAGDSQSSSDNTESLLVGDNEESTTHVNKQTTDLKEEEGLNADISTHTNSDILLDESSCEGTHVDNDTPPVESSSRETEVLHTESNSEEHSPIGAAEGSSVSSTRESESKTKMNCKGSNTDLDTGISCVESSLRDDSEDSRGSSLISSSGDSSIKEEVSHMGSSNGLLSVPIAKQRGKDLLCVGSSTDRHMRVQRGTTDIINKRKLSITNRKRKWSSERTLLENGDRAFNGNKHDRRAKNFKRSIDRSYLVSLPSSPDKDPSQDLSLEMIVSCSPPTPRTSQNKKTNASTQCDPEEVIVLSD